MDALTQDLYNALSSLLVVLRDTPGNAERLALHTEYAQAVLVKARKAGCVDTNTRTG